jgi:hypothetical protein
MMRYWLARSKHPTHAIGEFSGVRRVRELVEWTRVRRVRDSPAPIEPALFIAPVVLDHSALVGLRSGGGRKSIGPRCDYVTGWQLPRLRSI